MALNQAIHRVASRVVPLAIRASAGSQMYHHHNSAPDFGLGARGKSNPMRSVPSDRRSNYNPLFSDVFGGQPKYTPSSNSNSNYKNSAMSDFDYDSIFKFSSASEPMNINRSSNKASSVPVYDKPVYDEDIFDGLSGLKRKSAALSKSRNQSNDFDDLLGNLGRNEKSNMSSNAKSSSNTKGFDDLLAGFGSGSSAASNSNEDNSGLFAKEAFFIR
ncbi:auxilin-related protein 2 [Phtheirospermum japonicum]|uniref:Auxilin-related protein 2 n=1 Tax=Phtheirospermum japonicum TaxID=374723 RepID=A0A830CMM0_9LAMI|nr:auxilin-related protein 2 [Phtheirospermum japonicum]